MDSAIGEENREVIANTSISECNHGSVIESSILEGAFLLLEPGGQDKIDAIDVLDRNRNLPNGIWPINLEFLFATNTSITIYHP